MSNPNSSDTTTPTPTPREIKVLLKFVCVNELLNVRCADELRMSRIPARMPMMRNGRTGNTDVRKCPKTVWAISRRMITTKMPSIASTTDWGNEFQ